MDTSVAKRVGAFTDAELVADPHLDKLPDDTHIVSGTLVGHGDTSLASEKATLSAKVVKLERRADGGVDYQLAIFVSEPTPAPVVVLPPPEDPQFLAAVEYFVGKGLTDSDARKKVNQFGVSRVLAQKDRELDAELAKVVAGEPTAS